MYGIASPDFRPLLSSLPVPPNYDLLLVGDGSGTVLDKPCGYSCYIYDPKTNDQRLVYGGSNYGTNNFAELMAYILALTEDTYHLPSYPRRVEILTDSEITCKGINREYSRSANKILWLFFEQFENMGYSIHANWMPRNQNPISELMDEISGKARKSLDNLPRLA